MPPRGEVTPRLNGVVGDAAAGQKFFPAKCSGCHAVTGALRSIATRMPDAKTLQNTWVSGGGGRGGRGTPGSGQAGGNGSVVTVTVTLPSGEKSEGRLGRIDDFAVSLLEQDGSLRTPRRDGDRPAVEIHDPLEPHRQLLALYTDQNMHHVTAYLTTMK